jgi:hypothetical protein
MLNKDNMIDVTSAAVPIALERFFMGELPLEKILYF